MTVSPMQFSMRAFKTTLATFVLVSGTAALWTARVDAATATRTVKVKMVDIAFQPKTIDVAVGERIKFVFRNRGGVIHDAFIGDAKAQAQHEKTMRKTGNDHHGGNADDVKNAVTVKRGATARLTYTFKEPGTLEIGCHKPNHYDAGMKVLINVV